MMPRMIHFLKTISNPQQIVADHSSRDTTACISFAFLHKQSYLSHGNDILLACVCLFQKARIQCLIKKSNEAPSLDHLADAQLAPESYFKEVELLWEQKGITLDAAWRLETVIIPKPWGAEVWYTGMEDRGVCCVEGTPLPWLLSLLDFGLDEHAESSLKNGPILLKILDPYPDPNTGDLYFELHEKKTEVYIVTSIDHNVWPDGIGQIRYGFNQEKIDKYNTVGEFKSDYLASVEAYKETRDKIDSMLNDDSNHSLLPDDLHLNEQSLKKEMYSFTNLKSLHLGDVIHVQPYFPHSLQHGVRVIEFQTAHYERYILSFTQKVLTQDHWDTSQALTLAETKLPHDQPLTIIENSQGMCLERIADFEQFSTYRLSLEPEGRYEMKCSQYMLAIGIKGTSSIKNSWSEIAPLAPEESVLIQAGEISISTDSDKSVLLIAMPN
jgi:hypothetical protein